MMTTSILFIFSLFSTVSSLNILFYILVLGKSHVDFLDSLVDTLVDHGHSVDIILARMNSHVTTNGTNRADRKFIYGFKADSPWSKTPHLLDPFKAQQRDFSSHNRFINISTDICKSGLSNPDLHSFMKSKSYDIALGSDYDYCGFSLFHHYRIPAIASFGSTAIIYSQAINVGLPNLPAISQASLWHEDLSTFSGRFWNFLQWTNANIYMVPLYIEAQQKVISEYLDPSIDCRQVVRNIDLIFINTNEIIDLPQTISHKIKYIGGINMKDPQPIPSHLQSLFNLSSGVILFSFGTQVPSRSIKLSIVKAFVDSFRKFPNYTFLWKYDRQDGDDTIFANSSNIHTFSWLPQTDILYQPQTKLFISHVGLNSYLEASHAGVPILAIPLFVDQPYNSLSGQSIGTTFHLDKTNLTTVSITRALHTILSNSSFSKNAKKISKILKSHPEYPAKTKFVKWVEFLAENPGLHRQLNLPGAQLSTFYFYSLDIFGFFFVVGLSILLSIFWVFKQISKIIKGNNIRVVEPTEIEKNKKYQ